MEPLAIDHRGVRLLACVGALDDAGDALTVVSAAFEHDASGLVLDLAQLPPSFVDLRTGFAGEFVQKLQNYRLRTALVLGGSTTDAAPDARGGAAAHGERFREFLREARNGRVFRVFDARESALDWLAGHDG